jgi:hypothetical protein
VGYKITTSVWDHSRAKGGDLTLLLAIADNADNETAIAFPSIESLAKKSRMSKRTVQYAIVRLKKLKELSVIIRRGRGNLNFYRVDLHLRMNLIKGAEIAPFSEAEIAQTLHLFSGIKGANPAPFKDHKRCNPRQEKVQSATHGIERARDTLEPSLEPSLKSLSLTHSQNLSAGEREDCIKNLKRIFPAILSIPQSIPIERVYLFLHKVRTGEIRKETVYSPVAYMAKMLDEDITDPLRKERERRAQVSGGR